MIAVGLGETPLVAAGAGHDEDRVVAVTAC